MADVDNCTASPSERTNDSHAFDNDLYTRDGRAGLDLRSDVSLRVYLSVRIYPTDASVAGRHRTSWIDEMRPAVHPHTTHTHTKSELAVGQPTPSVPIVSLTQ